MAPGISLRRLKKTEIGRKRVYSWSPLLKSSGEKKTS
jgi:hypothetical protein